MSEIRFDLPLVPFRRRITAKSMIHVTLISLLSIGLLACGTVVWLVPPIRKAVMQSQRSTPPSTHDLLNAVCQQYNMTPREQDVMRLIVQGYRNKQISEELLVSVSTIKKHITKIYHKLNITSRHELIALINSPSTPSGVSSQGLSTRDDV